MKLYVILVNSTKGFVSLLMLMVDFVDSCPMAVYFVVIIICVVSCLLNLRFLQPDDTLRLQTLMVECRFVCYARLEMLNS